MRTNALTCAAIALLVSSCTDSAAGIVVDLRTDLVPGLEFVSVRSELTRSDDPGTVLRRDATVAATADALSGVRIAEWSDLTVGTWLVELSLLDAAGDAVVGSRVLTILSEGTRAVTVVVTRDCVGVVCGDDLTCVANECVDPRCSPETPAECPVLCTGDGDCAASTGAPECVVGRCVSQICFEAADHAMCASAAICDPERGCTGGPDDGGPDDGGSVDGGSDAGVDAGPGLLTGAVEIAVGYDHSCARLAIGEVVCWGSNSFGQLGDGTTAESDTPVQVAGIGDAAELALGREHSCVRRTSGQVSCWGGGRFGQLGNGDLSDSLSPVNVLGVSDATQITAGWHHSCAATPGGQGRCWGRGDRGQRFDGSMIVEGSTPNTIMGVPPVVGVAGGQIWACVWTTADETFCAGNNFSGQLGNGMTGSTSVPQVALGLSNVVDMGLGFGHSCALQLTELSCWGLNAEGQLGDGLTDDRSTPGVAMIAGPTDLAVGGWHTCAVRGADVFCWGRNSDGQLGDGTTEGRLVPTLVPGLSGITQIAAGVAHTCALGSGGAVSCWGANAEGELGDGTRDSRPRAAPVSN